MESIQNELADKTWKHSQYFFKQLDFLQLHPLLCRAEAGVLLDSSCMSKKTVHSWSKSDKLPDH